MSWTPDRVAQLRQFVASGQSAAQAGRKLGVTRSAAIGKARRLGLVFGLGEASTPTQRGQAGRRNGGPPTNPAPKTSRAFPQLRAMPSPKVDGRQIAPIVEPRHWLTRKFGECAWVIGEGGADAMSCCAPVEPGKSWCPAHMRLGTTVGRGAWASTTELIRSVRRFA